MMDMTLIAILAGFLIAVGAGFIYVILRGNDKPLPEGGVQWAATLLSVLLLVFSGYLLVLALHVPSPDEIAELHGDPRSDELDQPARNFAFRFVADDAEQTLEAYAGKVVLLNFWATWCAPCLQEIPDLNRLQQNYADDGLVIITLSDEARETLLDFEERLPLKTVAGYLPAPNDLPQPFLRTLAGRPTTYVIDREGYLRRFIKGAGDYAFFERLITPYLQDTLAAR